jgi:hypothetical protein
MTPATAAFYASLVSGCASAAAQKNASTALVCNLKAISAVERPRYNQLVKRVREAIRDRTEISNGYAFKLDSKTITFPAAAEWIDMERLCCPFLTLQLSAAGNQTHWILTLTGPEGVKPLVDVEFPMHRKDS